MEPRKMIVASLATGARESAMSEQLVPATIVTLQAEDGSGSMEIACSPAEAPALRDHFMVGFEPLDVHGTSALAAVPNRPMDSAD
jgi:hypothetical protein